MIKIVVSCSPFTTQRKHADMLHSCMCANVSMPSYKEHAHRRQYYFYLLVVSRVSRQVGEVNKLHVESPKLSQDAAACWCPTPVTTNTAGREGEGRGEQRRRDGGGRRGESVGHGGWEINVTESETVRHKKTEKYRAEWTKKTKTKKTTKIIIL